MSAKDFDSLFSRFKSQLDQLKLSDDTRIAVLSLLAKKMAAIVEAAAAHDGAALPGPAEDQAKSNSAAQAEQAKEARLSEAGAKELTSLELVIADRLAQRGPDAARQIFLLYDILGKGSLGVTAFRAAVNDLGVYLSEEEGEELVARWDTDNCGELDYAELERALSKVDMRMLSHSDYDDALVGRPGPVPPTSFHFEPNAEVEAAQLLQHIREKIVEHFGSSQEIFAAMVPHAGGVLPLGALRRGLTRLGLRVDPAKLRDLAKPYMHEAADRSALTVSELQAFLNGSRSRTGCCVAERPAPLLPHTADTKTWLYTVLVVLAEREGSMRAALARFDADGDGRVSPAELRAALHLEGVNVPYDKCVELVRAFDRNNNGLLNYSELMNLVTAAAEDRLPVRDPTARTAAAATTKPPRAPMSSSGAPPAPTAPAAAVAARAADSASADTVSDDSFAATPGRDSVSSRTSNLSDLARSRASASAARRRARSSSRGRAPSPGSGSAGASPSRAVPSHDLWSQPAPPSQPSSSQQAPASSGRAGAQADHSVMSQLLVRVADAVYSSGHSLHDLYRQMQAHGQLGVRAPDLQYGLHRLGVNLSADDAQSLVRAYGKHGNGALSMSDFVTMLSSTV